MGRAPYPSEAADKLLVRFPAGMRAKIEASAKAAGRSMNSEIIARLETSLEGDSDQELMKQMLAEHEDRLEEIDKVLKRLGRNMDIVAEKAGVDPYDRR